ncbi:uncharacterized, partial [Tachysurus ichikawai]
RIRSLFVVFVLGVKDMGCCLIGVFSKMLLGSDRMEENRAAGENPTCEEIELL